MSAAAILRIMQAQCAPITYESLTGVTRNTTTLQRSNTYASYTVSGYLRLFVGSAVTHLVQQGDRQLILPALNLSFTPKTNDRVTDSLGQKLNVVNVEPRYGARGELSLYFLHVRQDDGNP